MPTYKLYAQITGDTRETLIHTTIDKHYMLTLLFKFVKMLHVHYILLFEDDVLYCKAEKPTDTMAQPINENSIAKVNI